MFTPDRPMNLELELLKPELGFAITDQLNQI